MIYEKFRKKLIFQRFSAKLENLTEFLLDIDQNTIFFGKINLKILKFERFRYRIGYDKFSTKRDFNEKFFSKIRFH